MTIPADLARRRDAGREFSDSQVREKRSAARQKNAREVASKRRRFREGNAAREKQKHAQGGEVFKVFELM